VRATLADLGREDRQLFLEERQQLLEDQQPESPLLDQLCLLRVITARLAEGYAFALAKFEVTLEKRIRMRPGWRKTLRRKAAGEYESPMPWMHPFRLAREELVAVQDELAEAVASGETRVRQPERLSDVLAKHGLALPLPSPLVPPSFAPGILAARDGGML
jgi:hypothetical protein